MTSNKQVQLEFCRVRHGPLHYYTGATEEPTRAAVAHLLDQGAAGNACKTDAPRKCERCGNCVSRKDKPDVVETYISPATGHPAALCPLCAYECGALLPCWNCCRVKPAVMLMRISQASDGAAKEKNA